MSKKLFILLLLLVGCGEGGLQQNPLHEYPDYIQNAILPDNIPKKPTRNPIPSDFARIIVDGSRDMVVGKEFKMKVDAYLFLEDEMLQDFKVELKGSPPEGEEYSFEEVEIDVPVQDQGKNLKRHKEYLLKWTPSQDLLRNSVRRIYYLIFSLTTDGDLSLVREESIPVFISRDFEVPKITEVIAPSMLKEGETDEMIFHVEVLDSGEDFSPTLQFEQPQEESHSDLRPYLNFIEKKWLDGGKWEFKYEINLMTGSDLSESMAKYSFRVRAISSFGMRSSSTRVLLTVNNKVEDPVIIGPKDVTLSEGGRVNIFLSVSDPMHSGRSLEAELLNRAATLPGEVFLSYFPVSSGLEVSINWFLPKGIENLKDFYTLEILVKNRGREGALSTTKKRKHVINIHVEKLTAPLMIKKVMTDPVSDFDEAIVSENREEADQSEQVNKSEVLEEGSENHNSEESVEDQKMKTTLLKESKESHSSENSKESQVEPSNNGHSVAPPDGAFAYLISRYYLQERGVS